MGDPFTIRIFVPNGESDGIRIIDRMNWTGVGVIFPREKWGDAQQRKEFDGTAGVYILVGYGDSDDLPKLYIGEGDGVRDRINDHFAKKDFWSWGAAFVSKNRELNKAHVQWLEYALVKRASEVKQCLLDNCNTPQEPALTEGEKADMSGFLLELYRILPLVDLHAFKMPTSVVAAREGAGGPEPSASTATKEDPDTIVVPAWPDGFNKLFLGENCWYSVRIAGGMLPKLRWIAGYQVQPISAITHVAQVDHIEPYGDGKKYKVVFSGPAMKIGPIKFGGAVGGVQGPRYTTYSKLMAAKKIADL